MNITVVYNDDNTIKRLEDTNFKVSPLFTFIDDRTYEGRKKAFKVKSSLAARLSPFAVIYNEDNEPIKAFYTEASDDIITDLINYLQ